eukprot:940599-Pyramimonas_sp.AAC.1
MVRSSSRSKAVLAEGLVPAAPPGLAQAAGASRNAGPRGSRLQALARADRLREGSSAGFNSDAIHRTTNE